MELKKVQLEEEEKEEMKQMEIEEKQMALENTYAAVRNQFIELKFSNKNHQFQRNNPLTEFDLGRQDNNLASKRLVKNHMKPIGSSSNIIVNMNKNPMLMDISMTSNTPIVSHTPMVS